MAAKRELLCMGGNAKGLKVIFTYSFVNIIVLGMREQLKAKNEKLGIVLSRSKSIFDYLEKGG